MVSECYDDDSVPNNDSNALRKRYVCMHLYIYKYVYYCFTFPSSKKSYYFIYLFEICHFDLK